MGLDILTSIHGRKVGLDADGNLLVEGGIVPGNAAANIGALVGKADAFASITTAGNVTLTAAQILGGHIARDPNGGSRTDTLPTAALLVAAIPNAHVGQVIRCYIGNGADAAETITIGAGTGGTWDAASAARVIAQNAGRWVIIRLTNVTAGAEAYAVMI
jgi:hypothetical protein